MRYLRVIGLCAFSWILFFSCTDAPKNHPFSHDLHMVYEEKNPTKAIICFHGVGSDYRVKDSISSSVDATLVSFNFPEYKTSSVFDHPESTVYGSIDELLPALYVIRNAIVEKGFTQITLYGHSAGGAALINCLAVLNSSDYDTELKRIGISSEDRRKILEVIQKGIVILDTPLKSIEELMAHYGARNDLNVIGSRYKQNGMDPIDSIEKLEGLSLRVLLHFQIPDKVLSNRDDAKFTEKLQQSHVGTTVILEGHEGRHSLPHQALWDYYLKMEF